jgi:hypothetical protein
MIRRRPLRAKPDSRGIAAPPGGALGAQDRVADDGAARPSTCWLLKSTSPGVNIFAASRDYLFRA